MRLASDERQWWKRCWGMGLLAGMAVLLGGMVLAAGLNDTGQTTCYDDTGPVSPEPSTHPRQDCTMGRDAAAGDGVLPKIGAGSKGFDYTKIANNGSELQADATLGPGPDQWACTRDNLTGLVWEIKTNNGGLRDMGWTYTWYDDIYTDNNGGDAGWIGFNTCNGTLPNNECNSQAYVAAVKAVELCSLSNWRLPTPGELQGLVDYEIYPGPTIDSDYFPNTRQSVWDWSSSTDSNNPAYAWGVYFYYGNVGTSIKTNHYHVRLVHDRQ